MSNQGLLNPTEACSLGMLRSSMGFPDPGLPQWVTTFGKRMLDMGVKLSDIKAAVEEMEIERRKKVRAKLPGHVIITEFDEHLADLLNKFTQSK